MVTKVDAALTLGISSAAECSESAISSDGANAAATVDVSVALVGTATNVGGCGCSMVQPLSGVLPEVAVFVVSLLLLLRILLSCWS